MQSNDARGFRNERHPNLLVMQQPDQTSSRRSLLRDEAGITTVEYVIILFLIAASGIVIWREFGCTVHDSVGLAAFEIQELSD